MSHKVITDAEKIVLLSKKVSEEIVNPLLRMEVGDLVIARFKVKQMDGSYRWFNQEGTIQEVRDDLVHLLLITPLHDDDSRITITKVWTFRSMCEPRLTSQEI